MKAKLSLLEQIQPAHEFVLDRLPAVIGRGEDTQITLSDRWVSRHHCQIHERDGCLVVRDLNSKHGTFVNDQRITEALLRSGDTLTVGMSAFRVVCDPAVSSRARTSANVEAN